MTRQDAWGFIFSGLLAGYYCARKNKDLSKDRIIFEINLLQNLRQLTNDIIERKYKPSPGIAFVVYKPVVREIFAAPFRDRVVHHFLYNLTAEKFDEHFVYNSSSCRKNKGTLFAQKRLYAGMQSVSENFKKKAWVAKFDLSGFFMSLERDLLWEKVEERLRGFYKDVCDESGVNSEKRADGNVVGFNKNKRICEIRKLEYETVKYLWHEIIMDDPTVGVKLRGGVEKWKDVPQNKSLFCQKAGRGIVIGNLTSQLLSNIFLDKLDKFIVRDLKYKYYGRYVDDFYILMKEDDRDRFLSDTAKIDEYLCSMGLVLHPKKRYLQEISHGAKFLGVVVRPHRVLPDVRIVRNFKAELRRGRRARNASINSYIGMMRHVKGRRVVEKVIKKGCSF